MTQVFLNPNLLAQLPTLTQTVEICDASGRVLGRFIPHRDVADWEPVSPEVSDEELDRREAAGEKRYSTAEVLKHLGHL